MKISFRNCKNALRLSKSLLRKLRCASENMTFKVRLLFCAFNGLNSRCVLLRCVFCKALFVPASGKLSSFISSMLIEKKNVLSNVDNKIQAESNIIIHISICIYSNTT